MVFGMPSVCPAGHNEGNMVSDYALGTIQQVSSDISKSKRQSFLNVRFLTGIAEIVWQVTRKKRKCEVGYHRQTLGETIVLPVNRATVVPQHGSFRATRSLNGKHPRLTVPFFGFMGNVS